MDNQKNVQHSIYSLSHGFIELSDVLQLRPDAMIITVEQVNDDNFGVVFRVIQHDLEKVAVRHQYITSLKSITTVLRENFDLTRAQFEHGVLSFRFQRHMFSVDRK